MAWDPLGFLGGPEIEVHEGKFTIMQDAHHYWIASAEIMSMSQCHEAGVKVYGYINLHQIPDYSLYRQSLLQVFMHLHR